MHLLMCACVHVCMHACRGVCGCVCVYVCILYVYPSRILHVILTRDDQDSVEGSDKNTNAEDEHLPPSQRICRHPHGPGSVSWLSASPALCHSAPVVLLPPSPPPLLHVVPCRCICRGVPGHSFMDNVVSMAPRPPLYNTSGRSSNVGPAQICVYRMGALISTAVGSRGLPNETPLTPPPPRRLSSR